LLRGSVKSRGGFTTSHEELLKSKRVEYAIIRASIGQGLTWQESFMRNPRRSVSIREILWRRRCAIALFMSFVLVPAAFFGGSGPSGRLPAALGIE
jgi:hypothetical protein